MFHEKDVDSAVHFYVIMIFDNLVLNHIFGQITKIIIFAESQFSFIRINGPL
jgi:hypothetical protein